MEVDTHRNVGTLLSLRRNQTQSRHCRETGLGDRSEGLACFREHGVRLVDERVSGSWWVGEFLVCD